MCVDAEMANQIDDSPVPSAQIVGNAFIQQFYVALHKSPELVHKFYLDSSVLSRPGADGAMTSATTIQVGVIKISCNDSQIVFSFLVNRFKHGINSHQHSMCLYKCSH